MIKCLSCSFILSESFMLSASPVIFPQMHCACHTWGLFPCPAPSRGLLGGRTPPLCGLSTGGTAGEALLGCSGLHNAPYSGGPKTDKCFLYLAPAFFFFFTRNSHRMTVTLKNTCSVRFIPNSSTMMCLCVVHTCINSPKLCHLYCI